PLADSVADRVPLDQAARQVARGRALPLKRHGVDLDVLEAGLREHPRQDVRTMEAERDLVEGWRVVREESRDRLMRPLREHVLLERVPGAEQERPTRRQDPPRLPERRRLVRDEHQTELADRKSTRLNSSHVAISYAVFCLKKKNTE